MKKTISILLAGLIGVFAIQAQNEGVITSSENGRTITVTAVTDNIIRVDNVANGQSVPVEQVVLALTPNAKILSNTATSFTTNAGIKVALTSEGIEIVNANGIKILDSGVRIKEDDKYSMALQTNSVGSFYGAGERGHKLNMRGDTLTVYNRQNYAYTGDDPRISQMNITMPMFLSSEGFAIVFDDFAAAQMRLGNPIEYITEGDEQLSYYFIGGAENLAELTTYVTELTGRQSLPPLWALGYITSKYGYKTRQEAVGVVDTLKAAGYPLDGMVLDLYWYGVEQDMGRLEWDPDQWPNASEMLQELLARGVNMVTISQPYVLRNGRAIDNYNELAPKGMFVKSPMGGPQEVRIWVGEGGMFDVSNPETRQWLANRYKQLTDLGVSGWWGDLGEPEVHPEEGIHANGLSARKYHNKYGNDWSEIIYDLYSTTYPDRRPLLLMRGGTIGLQKYSVFPWSTDVSRSWGGLEPQVRIMINSGLSGLGYMGSDLGGFAVGDEPYIPELYLRWVQSGLFSPMLRTHAQQYAEPYRYPMYAQELLSVVKERYRWLPYNYTLSYENTTKGWPLVRPLDFHSNASGKYDNISDEYLWGKSILVAPVMTEGAKSRRIVFPEGAQWYDMSNPVELYDGGSVCEAYPTPIDVIPTFVRAGSFIPMADYAMDNTRDYTTKELTIKYYPTEGISEYTFFDDNHTTPSTIANGEYMLTKFVGNVATQEINIKISTEGSFAQAPAERSWTFEVYGIKNNPKNVVDANGEKIAFTHIEKENKIVFHLGLSAIPEETITISL